MQLLLILASYVIQVLSSSLNDVVLDKTTTSATTLENSSPTPFSIKKHAVGEEIIKKIQGYDYLEASESEENNSKDSDFDFIPVSLQHPLFKVFGINPDEYVVYYKYKRGQDRNIHSDIKYNQVHELKQYPFKKRISGTLKRPYRHTSEISDEDFYSEEYKDLSFDIGSNQLKKRSCNCRTIEPQPHQFPYVPYYPYPAPFLPPCNQYAYNNPMYFSPSPCQCNIPTCHYFKTSPHPYQFRMHPETYRRLSTVKNDFLQYPDESRDSLTRRK